MEDGSEKRHGFDAGNVKALAAAELLADRLIVDQYHVALRFLKLGAVALVAARGQAVLLGTHHPVQCVFVGGAAEGAGEADVPRRLRFGVIQALVHGYRFPDYHRNHSGGPRVEDEWKTATGGGSAEAWLRLGRECYRSRHAGVRRSFRRDSQLPWKDTKNQRVRPAEAV